MAPQCRLHLTGFGQPLERIRTRGLEHSITRNGIAFGEHQRFVDECTEVIEKRPFIDALVARDMLSCFEGKAPCEHTEAPKHRLLIGSEKRVAPFKRCT